MKHFFIIREDNPYLIYATRELAEKHLQRIIDLQHTGNIIIKKDVEVTKTPDGKLASVTITAYKRDIVGREYVSYSIKYAIEKVTLVEKEIMSNSIYPIEKVSLVEEEDKHDNQ